MAEGRHGRRSAWQEGEEDLCADCLGARRHDSEAGHNEVALCGDGGALAVRALSTSVERHMTEVAGSARCPFRMRLKKEVFEVNGGGGDGDGGGDGGCGEVG